MIALRDVDKVVQFVVIERAAVHGRFDVPVVTHLRDMHLDSGLLSRRLDIPRSSAASLLLAVGFIVPAVKPMAVLERVREHLVDEPLLTLPQHGILAPPAAFGRFTCSTSFSEDH